MMGSNIKALFFISMICMVVSLPPIYACGFCDKPPSPGGRKSSSHGGSVSGGGHKGKYLPPHQYHGHGGSPKVPPIVMPPIIIPPPVIIMPPPCSRCSPSYGAPGLPGSPGAPCGKGGSGGGAVPTISPPSPTKPQSCPIDALKLGVCLDVLGGLVHIGLGNPLENVCCPILQGLVELEAAICLCTAIRLKLLNLTIYIPLALSVLVTCGKTPPPAFTCPPIS